MVKKIGLLMMIIIVCSATLSANWGDIFKQMGEQMQEDMRMMHEKFNEMFTREAAQQKIFINEEENHIVIKVALTLPASIKADNHNFQADVHDDIIHIIIPETHETISVGIENNLLGVSATLKTKKEKKGKHGVSMQTSTQHYQQNILMHHLVDLTKATIEYDNEGIIITIPYQKMEHRKGKSIQITPRVSKQKEVSSSSSATSSEK